MTWTTPPGAVEIPYDVPGVRAFRMGECCVLASVDPLPRPTRHLSVSCRDRLPTWDEVRMARGFAPDGVVMAMILPPMRHYVNLHQYCFHLYEMPEYWGGRMGT